MTGVLAERLMKLSTVELELKVVYYLYYLGVYVDGWCTGGETDEVEISET